jgi:hypothetical protein
MKNFYTATKSERADNPNFELHRISIPFRMTIAAPSGSGKTNALLNMLAHMGKVFHEIHVVIPTADEPLYKLLSDKLGHGVVFHENYNVPAITQFQAVGPDGQPKRLDKRNRLFVFDDMVLDKKANRVIQEYYIRGRKLGISSCYISQSFYQIPKLIRDNAQYHILGRNLLKRDLREIMKVFPSNLSADELVSLYEQLCSEPLDVVLFDIPRRRIRKNIVDEDIAV